MKKQLIWVFEWRKSVHYWWSYILFSPECKELTSMLDPLLYRWGVPPVVIRCVHWTMQMWVLQTWIIAQGPAIVMKWVYIQLNLYQYFSYIVPIFLFPKSYIPIYLKPVAAWCPATDDSSSLYRRIRTQGRVDRHHVSALGQREGLLYAFPTIQDGPSSSAEDCSVTRSQGDSDRSTSTGRFMVSGVDGSVSGRSNPAVRRGSNTAVIGDVVTKTHHYWPSNLHAWKLYGPSWGPRAIPGKLLTWCQSPFVTHHSRCMNHIGRDLCPSVGRKDGTCFESEAIISVAIWCTCSETDFSQRRLFHIARLWLLCYVIRFAIQQPIRTSSYSSELSSWNVRCNAE